MKLPENSSDDVVAEYVRTFYEWRAVYGLMDDCIDELHAAVLVESEKESLSEEVQGQLRALAQFIQRERSSVLNRAA